MREETDEARDARMQEAVEAEVRAREQLQKFTAKNKEARAKRRRRRAGSAPWRRSWPARPRNWKSRN